MSENHIDLDLPPEFVDLCKRHGVAPEFVLRGFIADLCGLVIWMHKPRHDGYCSNGPDQRAYARRYYERVGYPWWNQDMP